MNKRKTACRTIHNGEMKQGVYLLGRKNVWNESQKVLRHNTVRKPAAGYLKT